MGILSGLVELELARFAELEDQMQLSTLGRLQVILTILLTALTTWCIGMVMLSGYIVLATRSILPSLCAQPHNYAKE